MGATSVIDPNREPLARDGAAPEIIFECVGAPGLIRACMDLLPVHGRLVVVGVNRGEDTILPRVAIRKELRLQFALGYQREDFALVLDLMASGRIDAEALISSVIGLAELPDVVERLRRPNPDAKVLIDPSR